MQLELGLNVRRKRNVFRLRLNRARELPGTAQSISVQRVPEDMQILGLQDSRAILDWVAEKEQFGSILLEDWPSNELIFVAKCTCGF